MMMLLKDWRNSVLHNQFDVICIGMALVDSIIKGFDPSLFPPPDTGRPPSLNVGGKRSSKP